VLYGLVVQGLGYQPFLESTGTMNLLLLLANVVLVFYL